MEYRFREIRENRFLKQQEIADIMGVSRGGYANIEIETANIKLKNILKYCNHFGYSIDYVCHLSNKPFIKLQHLDNIDKKIIRDRLTLIENEQGKSANDIADILGVVKTTYSEYKNPNCPNIIQTLMLKKLCKKYNYSMDWVLGRSDKKHID